MNETKEATNFSRKISIKIDTEPGRSGSKIKIITFGVLIIFSGFHYGFNLSQFSTFFEYFFRGRFGSSIAVSEYNNIISFLNTFFILGGTFCAIFSVFIIKTQSPKKLNLLMILLLIILMVVQIWMPLYGLYAVRFLIGIVVVFLFSLGPIIVNHCVPPDYSGPLGMMFGFFIGLGVIVGSSISSDISQEYWYLFLCLPVPFEILRFILLLGLFPYESPYYIYAQISQKNHKKFQKKKKTERNIESQNITDQKKEIKEQIKNEFLNHPQINKLVSSFYLKEDAQRHKLYMYKSISHYETQKNKQKGVCATACSKEYRKQFFTGIILNLANQWTGINVFVLYAKQIYIDLGLWNPDMLVFIGSKTN
jgi:MFS family permease